MKALNSILIKTAYWRKVLLLAGFIGTLSLPAQELEFTATASKTELGQNQRFRVEYSVNRDGTKNFTPPDFKGFEIVAGPSSSVSQSWINGVSSYSKTYTYILEPTAQGSFEIAPAQITYKGKRYESNPLHIKVTKPVELPKDPNDPEYAADNEVFLVAHISNTKPYVGEGIYVEYRLYFSGRIRIMDADFGEMPKYEGFWNQEINVDQEEKTGMYKGKQFHYYTLKKAVLIPQKAGNLTVEPVKMKLLLAVPTGKYDFFGTPLMRRIRKKYTSGKRNIQVQPLPGENRPDSFTGAVGTYELSVIPGKTQLNTNEAVQVKVQVKGKGNLKLFKLPGLKVPSELELYEPEHNEKIITTAAGLKGSVTDTYTIVPSYPGKYKIPAVHFSYFNPADRKYHSISSNEIILDVGEGKSVVQQNLPEQTRTPIHSSGEVFRFIATKTRLVEAREKNFYNTPLYYLLLFLIFASLPAGIVAGRHHRKLKADKQGVISRRRDKLSRQYLAEAERKMQDKEAFYVALEKALHLFLKAKLRIETSQLSKENIQALLRDRGAGEEVIQMLMDLLNQCETVRYAPGSVTDTQRDYNKAKEWINRFNKEIKS